MQLLKIYQLIIKKYASLFEYNKVAKEIGRMNRLYLDEDRTIQAEISSDASLQTDEINYRPKSSLSMKDLGFYFSLYCQQIKKQLNKYINKIVRDFHSQVELFLEEQSDKSNKSKQHEQSKIKLLKLQMNAWKPRLQEFQQKFQGFKKSMPYFYEKKRYSKLQQFRKIRFIEILDRFLTKTESSTKNVASHIAKEPSKIHYEQQISQIQHLYDASQYEEVIIKAKQIQKTYYKQSSSQLNFIRANCYKALGFYRQAVVEYNKAIQITPKGCYYNNRGNCYLCLQKIELAEEDYKKAIQFQPNNEVFLGNYGNICLTLQKYQQSIDLYSKAIKLGSQNDFFYNNKAFAEIKLMKYTEAIESYNTAIQLNPQNHVYLKNRANLFMRNNRINQAINDIKKAIEIEPTKHDYHYLRGKWEYLSGRYKQSMICFRKACELQPNKQTYKDYYYAIKNQLGLR